MHAVTSGDDGDDGLVMLVTDKCRDFRALQHWCMPLGSPTSLTSIRQFLPTQLHWSLLDKMDLQVIVNSFQPLVAQCSLDKPPCSLVCGQDSTMCDIVWVSPQEHWSESVSFHFFLQAPQWPCPVRKRFRSDHCCRGRAKPGCRIVGSSIDCWCQLVPTHTTKASDHSVMPVLIVVHCYWFHCVIKHVKLCRFAEHFQCMLMTDRHTNVTDYSTYLPILCFRYRGNRVPSRSDSFTVKPSVMCHKVTCILPNCCLH